MNSRLLTTSVAALASLALAAPRATADPAPPLRSGLLATALPFRDVLARASDRALDKLGQPGAFAADDAIRIGLPGPARKLDGLLAMAGKTGVGPDITASLNTAAGQAAAAARPIFRTAIQSMTLQDAGGLMNRTGATDYLRQSAGGEIHTRLRPLVRTALIRTGVLRQASSLATLGLTTDRLVDYVTDKTADGIFTYMGREETTLRQNPLSLLQK
jgi:hypothetical protein